MLPYWLVVKLRTGPKNALAGFPLVPGQFMEESYPEENNPGGYVAVYSFGTGIVTKEQEAFLDANPHVREYYII